MQGKLSEHKKSVLCRRNYVYLDGKWRNKDGGASVSDFAVRVLADEDFEGSMERYGAALSRHVHQAHLGAKLFSYEP
jgi:hypothetical protein